MRYSKPIRVSPVQIVAAPGNFYVRDNLNRIWGVGTSETFQLGSQIASSSPILIRTTKFQSKYLGNLIDNEEFIDITAGPGYVMGLDGNYNFTWGWGADYFVGADYNTRSSPVSLIGNHSFVSLPPTSGNTMSAMKDDGSIWTWGTGSVGELGNNTNLTKFSPVSVVGSHSFIKIGGSTFGLWLGYSNTNTALTYMQAIPALKDDGSAWIWGCGTNTYGHTGTNEQVDRSSPVSMVGGHSFSEIHISKFNGVALKSGDGSAWGWGLASYGGTGESSATSRSSPVSVVGAHSFSQIAHGYTNSFGLKSNNGTVWSWGWNLYGQLGDGSVSNRSSPVSMVGAHSFVEISAGEYQFWGLKSDGSLWGCGYNYDGELGINSGDTLGNIGRSSPTSVVGNHAFTKVRGGRYATYALKSDGSVWAWGVNYSGHLGDGTFINRSSPVSVIGAHSFVDICCARWGFYGLKDDGSIWIAGEQDEYEAMHNTNKSPIKMISNHSFSSILAADRSLLGFKNDDGSVWVAGRDTWGSSGNNTMISRLSAVKVVGNHSFAKIGISGTGGIGTYCALKDDGSCWTWGINGGLGLIGDATVINRSSPTSVVGGHSFVNVVNGGYQIAGSKSDGSTWVWGYNLYGTCGDLTINWRSSPVSVKGSFNFSEVSGQFLTLHGLQSEKAWGWGYNSGYIIGVGIDGNPRSSPVSVQGNFNYSHLTGGQLHVIGLLSTTGTVRGWGSNQNGCVGNGTTTAVGSPVSVVGDHSFIKAQSGYYHNIALKSDGSAWGWGENQYGQLGDNSFVHRSSPVSMVGGYSFIDVTCGPYASYLLNSDGEVYTVGYNPYTIPEERIFKYPVPIYNCSTSYYQQRFQRIFSGFGMHVGKRKTDLHGLWGWGNNFDGQLGFNVGLSERSSPVSIGYSSFVNVTIGEYNSAWIEGSSGLGYTCGRNVYGNLGNNTLNYASTPTALAGAMTYLDIQIAEHHSIGLSRNVGPGTVWCWGYNGWGQLGTNNVTWRSSPTSVLGAHTFTKIAAAYGSCMGLKSTGTVWAWGLNDHGQLGDGTIDMKSSPVLAVGDHSFIDIIATYNSVYCVKSDGSIWAWGGNSVGQLGDGTTDHRSSPVSMLGFGSTLYAYPNKKWNKDYYILNKEGYKYQPTQLKNIGGVVLRNDGQVMCWGVNTYGAIGDGTATHRSVPVPVVGNHSFVSLGCIYPNSGTIGAIKSDGSVWMWGYGQTGSLGNGAITDRSSPVSVLGNHSFVDIRGSDNTLALKSDGSAWGWGNAIFATTPYINNGDGTATKRSSPVSVVGSHSFTWIGASYMVKSGVKSDGSVWTWSDNQWGQLGDSSITPRSSPVSVVGSGSAQIFVKSYHADWSTCLIDDSSRPWTIGNFSYGQLGENTNAHRSSPVSVVGAHVFTQLTSGYHMYAGLKSDGSVWAWGRNDYGELGDYSITNRSSPVSVIGNHSFIQINAFIYTMYGLKEDRSIWAWGLNTTGQLGNGELTNRSSPVSIFKTWR